MSDLKQQREKIVNECKNIPQTIENLMEKERKSYAHLETEDPGLRRELIDCSLRSLTDHYRVSAEVCELGQRLSDEDFMDFYNQKHDEFHKERWRKQEEQDRAAFTIQWPDLGELCNRHPHLWTHVWDAYCGDHSPTYEEIRDVIHRVL